MTFISQDALVLALVGVNLLFVLAGISGFVWGYRVYKRYREDKKTIHLILDTLVDSSTDSKQMMAVLESKFSDYVLKKKYNELVVAHNKVVERMNEINHKVKYIMDCWTNEWDAGSSWKNGFRPDGSSVYEDEDGNEFGDYEPV